MYKSSLKECYFRLEPGTTYDLESPTNLIRLGMNKEEVPPLSIESYISLGLRVALANLGEVPVVIRHVQADYYPETKFVIRPRTKRIERLAEDNYLIFGDIDKELVIRNGDFAKWKKDFGI